jgi:hypothetical protein
MKKRYRSTREYEELPTLQFLVNDFDDSQYIYIKKNQCIFKLMLIILYYIKNYINLH